MKRIAIKGHALRNVEVVNILEMLGGEYIGYDCDIPQYYYYIDYDDDIYGTAKLPNTEGFEVYTLEEFLEKFPYKVGDKVSVCEYETEVRIDDMKWDGFEIQYSVFTDETEWYSAEELNKFNKPYKEETMEETDTINHTTEINLNHPCFGKCNEIELIIPAGWEFEQRGNKMFGVRKQYPKTYEECCNILNLPHCGLTIDVPLHYSPTIIYLTKLLICRDAYWKIAGEQMGLEKPWELSIGTPIYYIYYNRTVGTIKNDYADDIQGNIILAFPTAEMRDAFYENFKELIKACKKLL